MAGSVTASPTTASLLDLLPLSLIWSRLPRSPCRALSSKSRAFRPVDRCPLRCGCSSVEIHRVTQILSSPALLIRLLADSSIKNYNTLVAPRHPSGGHRLQPETAAQDVRNWIPSVTVCIKISARAEGRVMFVASGRIRPTCGLNVGRVFPDDENQVLLCDTIPSCRSVDVCEFCCRDPIRCAAITAPRT